MLISLLQQAQLWLASGSVAWWTVANTFGGSPRPPGTVFVVNAAGAWQGSISGGCVEEFLLERAFPPFFSPTTTPFIPEIHHFGINSEQAARFGLPCGGQMTVVKEIFHPNAETLQRLKAWEQALQQRQALQRLLNLKTGDWQILPGLSSLISNEELFAVGYPPRWRLLLIGAGALCQELVYLAQRLDYEIVVCEPRAAVYEQWTLPSEVMLTTQMPDDAVEQWVSDEFTVVLTTSHDPKLDDLALLAALPSQAFYVGALGSIKTNAKRRERLAFLGVASAVIARLHGPMGLPLGSKQPAEIAIAVFAEIIQLQKQAQLSDKNKES